MAPVSWDSVRSLVIFFGPILLPKAISYYRSIRQSSRTAGLRIRPIPPSAVAAILLLSTLAASHVLRTLPWLTPENVFSLTQSRLQVPVDVLFNRAAAFRPSGALTPADHALRARFVNLESRLLYLQFGGDVVASCPFCVADEPKSYFYYALPAILWPHIANAVAVAVVTSPAFTGRHGAQWRAVATIAAAVLAALELYLVGSYNYMANSRALRLPELDMFFWSMRAYRFVALALLDAGLAWLLYLSSTHRAFAQPPSTAERVEGVTRGLATVKSRLNALGIVRNTALRDEDLRTRNHAYWGHEVRLMGEVMEDREVIDGVNDALSNRIKIQEITNDAEQYSQTVLQPLQATMASDSKKASDD
ncbi:hypothetical protein N3K66_003158 [Trichothecium roseum]|uniref:Uncharacterized protein n=1 Tax=Trichothecium roseum TaxID=47278 RepID=A0ACC0V5Y5_9HYPO|nr:hypothetical protein N3K66_003158 [Trichothecium roseum]